MREKLNIALFIALALSWITFSIRTRPEKVEYVQPTQELKEVEVLKDSSKHYSGVATTTLDNSELKETLQEQKQILKELGIKIKSLQSSMSVATVAEYAIPLPQVDSVTLKDTIKQDIQYSSKWIDAKTKDDSLVIRTRDSLDIFVSRIYRHKFLWWKWGTKGYNVDIVNHNPYSTITYNKVVVNGKQ